MKDGPKIASIAALIGDPGRADMLGALMDGRALTVSELATTAGVALPTASGHLAKLDAAGLIAGERQGRHRYFRLAGADVAHVLEALMGIAERTGAKRVRAGPRDGALRAARICYDHLAGEQGVRLYDALVRNSWIAASDGPEITTEGEHFFEALGIDVAGLARGRRPLCRACLDWSERRAHLGGALGAAVLDFTLAKGWTRRAESRVIAFSPRGADAFAACFGIAA